MKKNIIRDKKLDESYAYCREQARKHSVKFYLGMLFTSKKKRGNIFSIYTWLRVLDDITDNENDTLEKRKINLIQFCEKTFSVMNEKMEYCYQLEEEFWPAFRDTIIQYHISTILLKTMIAGQEQDLVKNNYKTFQELYEYCRLVDSPVGLMCMQIWGYTNAEKTRLLAEWCGVFFQLTNILCDINDDFKLNRIYLPAEFFNRDKLTIDDFFQISQEEKMKGINKIILKADEYYQKSEPLYKYLHLDGRLSFLIMVSHYRSLFNKIRSNPEAIFGERKVKLNRLEKFYSVFKVIFKYMR